MKSKNNKTLGEWLPIALGVLVIGIISWLGVGVKWDNELLLRFGYLGVFVAMLVSSSTVFLPGPAVAIPFAAANLLNPYLVILAAAAGSCLGELTGYWAGSISRLVLSSKRGTWYATISQAMKRYAFVTIFLLSAVPNLVTDIAGIIAGHVRYPIGKFLLSTFLGKIVRFGLVVLLAVWTFR